MPSRLLCAQTNLEDEPEFVLPVVTDPDVRRVDFTAIDLAIDAGAYAEVKARRRAHVARPGNGRGSKIDWSDKGDRLRDMLADGVSYAEIGRSLGVTRDAVIGYVRRMP